MALPAQAQRAVPGQERRIEDLATQPLSDVNLKRKEIPAILSTIIDNPYDLTGIRKCRHIIAAVRDLDAVLGPDVDEVGELSKGEKRKQTALGMAGNLIGGLIPFRFLVREISGANKSEQEYRAAVYAGVIRRGFLKGVGQARRCKPPGRPRALPVAAP